MARAGGLDGEESQPLTGTTEFEKPVEYDPRPSSSSISTTSLVFDHIKAKDSLYSDKVGPEQLDIEDQPAWQRPVKPSDQKARRILWTMVGIGVVGWVAALFLFLHQGRSVPHLARPHDPHATSTTGNGKKVTLEQVQSGSWIPRSHAIEWFHSPNSKDNMLLERGGQGGKDYLVLEDVEYRGADLATQKEHSQTLMKQGHFVFQGEYIRVSEAWPSSDLKKVLVQSDLVRVHRHSTAGRYWIFDVEAQQGRPLDPDNVNGRIQFASWSPKGDAVVFTRDNNLFYRQVDSDVAIRITTDGGENLFYGIPDWVYEEEVLASGGATWWSADGRFIAFFRTDESQVPTFPVHYFFNRPSGTKPRPGEENYPEVKNIKYPKAGAPISVVTLQFYDIEKKEVFTVPISDDFADDDRLITEVFWGGDTGKAIVRSTNRESDLLKIIVVDAVARSGKTVRERDLQKLDGGWFEVTHTTTFIPADPDNNRPYDGYVDTVVHDNYDHLAYFTPLENPEPRMLTQGDWEVVDAPSRIDLEENLVYFVSTQEGSTQRHLYTVPLNAGSDSIKAVTDTKEIAYYGADISNAGKYMLLSYRGPGIPWQKIQATPSNRLSTLDLTIEENTALNKLAKETELPIEIYQTINVDGFELNLVEKRPPHFDENKRYPVLFHPYNGPGAQEVNRRFAVDFQSFVASSLGYIVVTLDGRGTGFKGRKHRNSVRGNLGYWEAHDQIAAAKMWAAKKYVDAERIAMWGWSYGGFMTLKTLETDAGRTFKYGMAVAPVTDWRFYDSAYTERYMHTPQHNPEGYNNASIHDMKGLASNVRFLVMHGASDDNVHFQNTLSLLDNLDQANVRNYDVHVFPDSDHNIAFHNGNQVVYEKLRDWLINAFNGEWLRTDDPRPMRQFEGLP